MWRRCAGPGPRRFLQRRPNTASETWGTVGVSENIIEASWKALVDSITYKLKKEYGYKRQPTETHTTT